MAQTTTIELPAGEWVQLTNAGAAAISVQNRDPQACEIMGTVNTTAPSSNDGAFGLMAGDGLRNVTLAEIWPGSAFVHLWAISHAGGRVTVSHADA